MLHSESPELQADHEKEDAGQRRKPLNQRRRAQHVPQVENCVCRKVIDRSQWDDKREDGAEPRAVDGKRELRRFDTAIGGAVHNLERFGRPETYGRLENEQPGK